MKFSVSSVDKSAVALSALCLVHCLVFPVLTVLLPSLAVIPLEQELFHMLMVICVIPVSIYALTMGCKKHNTHSVAYLGGTGLLLLIAAVVLGEHHLGELGEKLMTTLGALVIAAAHIRNFKHCQQSDECPC